MSGLTIGEVLNRLKDEFPDITISKIRFLDAEGLVEPDRTPAGYRQFTEADVARLQYVLTAQRDRGLRLSHIAEELRRLDAGEDPREVVTGAAAVIDAMGGLLADGDEEERAEHVPGPVGGLDGPPLVTDDEVEVRLSGRELADRSGLGLRDVRSLQEHALLPPGDVFDGHALATAAAAAGLLRGGLEARHLRMYRQFADRELSMFQQLVQPILRQRNPEAQRRAAEMLDSLTRHGTELHAALLRRELRDLLDP